MKILDYIFGPIIFKCNSCGFSKRSRNKITTKHNNFSLPSLAINCYCGRYEMFLNVLGNTFYIDHLRKDNFNFDFYNNEITKYSDFNDPIQINFQFEEMKDFEEINKFTTKFINLFIKHEIFY